MKVKNNMSFVRQDFIWYADYLDGSQLFEFDPKTKKANRFQDIDKRKLLRFGVFGGGINLSYCVPGGEFDLHGNKVNFSYVTKSKEYHLTGNSLEIYNDLIQYKDATSALDIKKIGRATVGNIIQYNF